MLTITVLVEAAAIEVETEPTSEHCNAALKLLQFLPFQPKDMAKIHLTRCRQNQKVVCFTKVGGTLSMANYNAVPDFVVFFCMNILR